MEFELHGINFFLFLGNGHLEVPAGKKIKNIRNAQVSLNFHQL